MWAPGEAMRAKVSPPPHVPRETKHDGGPARTSMRFGGHRRGWKYVRRRPTLPPGRPGSTIGADGLSFRVRNGAGRFPVAMAAETLWRCDRPPPVARPVPGGVGGVRFVSREPHSGRERFSSHTSVGVWVVASYRLISTGQLHASLVRTSTSSLSTQSSSWEPLTLGRGDLILKRASRLDAFSGYPFRT